MPNGANGTTSTCSGTFRDGAGDYASSLNSTRTFCPSTPGDKVRITFTAFDTESGYDYLDVWNANAVGVAGTEDDRFMGTPTVPFTITSTSPDGCLSFRFISDGGFEYAGFTATISCVTPCTPPTAALVSSSTVDICPSTSLSPGSSTVAFNASSSTSPTGSVVRYEWDWGDGTASITAVPNTTHVFPTTGGLYVVRLRVRNDNFSTDPLGCLSANSVSRTIRVMPNPSFIGTSSSAVPVSCGSSVTLNGLAVSQTIIQATPTVISSPVNLPDGSGSSYTSSLDFSGLFPASAVLSAGCYPTLTFDLEHSYAGDLIIELISPSGQSVTVFNGNADPILLFGSCADTNTDGVPGCVEQYSVVNSGGVNWSAAGNTTTATTNCAIWGGACEAGDYYIGQTYNSLNSFSALIGANLNGVWTLKITDDQFSDDGVLSNWSLTFPTSCYGSLQTITPDLATATWSTSGSGPAVPAQTTTNTVVNNPGPACPSPGPCVGNQLANDITLGPFPTAGSFVYSFTVTDEFGCQYRRNVTVTASCVCPAVTTFSYAGTPFCSTSGIGVVTLTGTGVFTGGTFTSTAGLTINSATGTITPSTSTPGAYIVTYNYAPGGGCPVINVTTSVTINPQPNAGTDGNTTVCDSSITSIDLFSLITGEQAGGTWTQTSGTGGVFNAGTGAYTPAMGATTSSFTYTLIGTAPCINDTSLATININPVLSYTVTNPICNGSPLDFNYPSGSTFTWTASNNDLSGFNSSGDQTDINQMVQLFNPMSTSGSISMVILPNNSIGCIGDPISITILVNPKPEVTSITQTDDKLCSGETLNMHIIGEPSGTIYNWTAISSNVTIVGAGNNGTTTGLLNLQLTTSNPLSQGTIQFQIIPVRNGCYGTPFLSDLITVNPLPGNPIGLPHPAICSGESTNINVSENLLIVGTQLKWNVIASNYVTGFTQTGIGTAPISINDILFNSTNVQGFVTYRITSVLGECEGTYTDITVLVNPLPKPVLTGGHICVNATTGITYQGYVLDTQLSDPNFTYDWFMFNTTTNTYEPIAGANASTYVAMFEGNYQVIVTNSVTNCSSDASADVIKVFPATAFTATVSDAFTDNSTITVTVNPIGTGSLIYALDDGAWQDSNVFTGVEAGIHTILVSDLEGCTNLTIEVIVIDYPKYFTPNGDGIHDTWNIIGLNQADAKLYIFDRYGKLLKQISTTDQSKGWDGTYNGAQLPSTDYWFTIDFTENGQQKQLKSHSSLKR